MFVEGMSNGGDRPHSWTRFSGAMVRQAVDDGMQTLPSEQNQLIKLAYFGGLSNAEIAQRMGVTVGGVERSLQQAIARVGEYVERGRNSARRAVYAVILFFFGRSLANSEHAVSAAALVTVATLMVASPASPPQLAPLEREIVPAPVSVQSDQNTLPMVAPVPGVAIQIFTAREVHVALPVTLPMTLPIQLKAPPLPPVPLLHGLLGA
jgi:predicted DNA-binding protein (UPF0251 family)